jgi:hypothetical protein
MLNCGFPGWSTPVSIVVFAGSYFGKVWMPADTAFDPDTWSIALGSNQNRTESDAQDGQVIVHEMTHALQYSVQPSLAQSSFDISATNQIDAIMEGQADFAAASVYNIPQIMKYSANMWGEGMFVRNVDNFYTSAEYPATPDASPYEIGMVYSGALWDLRSVVGATVSETLAMKAFALLPNNNPSIPGVQATLVDALNAMVQADTSLYGGSHADLIRQAFGVHGIGTYNFSTPYPMVLYPGNNYNGTQSYTVHGAQEVAVTFDQFVTKLDDASFTTDESPQAGIDVKSTVDYLQLLDGAGDVIGTYTGRELEGQTIRVPGDTVQFHLVTDDYRASFGYRVVNMWNVPDVNGDGVVNAADIDTIYANFTAKTGVYNVACDVNGDGVVDQNDVTYELNHFLYTSYGDANLDGKTDFVDFQSLLAHWQGSGTGIGWADGDFNGDGTVDFLDFQVLLAYWNPGGWNFAPSQVPEPATLMLLGLGGLLSFRRRSR